MDKYGVYVLVKYTDADFARCVVRVTCYLDVHEQDRMRDLIAAALALIHARMRTLSRSHTHAHAHTITYERKRTLTTD